MSRESTIIELAKAMGVHVSQDLQQKYNTSTGTYYCNNDNKESEDKTSEDSAE